MPLLSVIRRACRGFVVLAGVAGLAACSSLNLSGERFFGLITPYRADVVQGNVVTKEQLDQLKPGLTRDQVRQLLGAPLLTDPFHADRWDYVFLMRRQGTEPQSRSLVVRFAGERVSSVEAPTLPTENEFVAAISRAPVSTRDIKLVLTPEERASLPPPTPREAAAAAAAPLGAARTYPPLETTP